MAKSKISTGTYMVTFPEHMLVVGRTASGKSSLVGDMFSNIDHVYRRNTKDNIIVVMSPHEVIDQSFIKRFNSNENWTIIYFSIDSFDENSANGLLAYLKNNGLLHKEVFLFLDDLAINACASKKRNNFILKAFATYRHYNISLIVTVQVAEKDFVSLMENSGLVIVLKNFGYHKTLEMMLRTFVFSIKVPSLIRRLSSFFSETKHIGDHVVFNFTFPAAQNSVYFITDNIINYSHGYTKREIENLCKQL